jgi:hypothetical protein
MKKFIINFIEHLNLRIFEMDKIIYSLSDSNQPFINIVFDRIFFL